MYRALFCCFFFMNSIAQASMSCSSLFHADRVFDFTFKQVSADKIEAYVSGSLAGHIHVRYYPGDKTLSVVSLEVDQFYRKAGLSLRLLQQSLRSYSRVEQISAALTELNLMVYQQTKKRILRGRRDKRPTYEDGLASVQQTPAYKIRKALGFSKIVLYDRSSEGLFLIVEKDSLAI